MAKEYILRPKLRRYWPHYLLGILTAPLAGVGIWWILRIRNRAAAVAYRVNDTGIAFERDGSASVLSLEQITMASVSAPWVARVCGLGDIHIETADGRTERMEGIDDAETVASLINAATAQARANAAKRPIPPPPLAPAGSLEPLNDLVGLWQQGLITDEEYDTERRRLEKR